MPTATIVNHPSFLDELRTGQAVVGLELARPDYPLLEYLRFLFGKIVTGEVRFVHVVPRLEFFYWEDQDERVEVDKTILARMEEEISAFFKEASRPKASLEIKEGNPLEELLLDTEAVHAKLVVLGQRGLGGHNIAARRLARKVSCPILVVPEAAEATVSKILVPVDFSPSSVKALQAALAMRAQVNPAAEIVCVNIYELPDLSAYRLQRTPEALRQMVEEDRTEAFRAFLREYAGEAATGIETVLINKDVPGIAHYLLEYADEHNCDLIVVGAKGHSQLERLVLGSVTESLLAENDEYPVLIIK
jgi:nucleotide-binding universal stress UspA family protein